MKRRRWTWFDWAVLAFIVACWVVFLWLLVGVARAEEAKLFDLHDSTAPLYCTPNVLWSPAPNQRGSRFPVSPDGFTPIFDRIVPEDAARVRDGRGRFLIYCENFPKTNGPEKRAGVRLRWWLGEPAPHFSLFVGRQPLVTLEPDDVVLCTRPR